jgi:trans-2,3-dihydro-3-hydroxyanthranilate isomerase
MRYPFYTCDVFTDTRFGGNQLAVFPRAEGLSDAEMQQIAREFNFAETSFVFPGGPGFTRRVRIFTPTIEVPFAGHPNVGTAAMLAAHGELGDIGESAEVVFDELAGPVAITIVRRPGNRFRCDLTAPEALSLGARVPVAAVAAAAGLDEADVVTRTHEPQFASVGLGFLMAELRDVDALRRARPNFDGLVRLEAFGSPFLHCYVRSGDAFDLRTRGLAAYDPGMEDPATGSANAALTALLAHHEPAADGDFAWRIAQGVEMGRPSVLEARVEKRGGVVTRVRIGGETVGVTEGTLEL